MKAENKFIKDYYDSFSKNLIGFNERHRYISKWLMTFGLKEGYNVLEIGCGPGESTRILTNAIKTGKIVAVDISSENIKTARETHKQSKNIEFLVSDMSDLNYQCKFDIIVLPDVLEHIPIDQHTKLFKTIRRHLKDDGIVVIHIPDPKYLEFERTYRPEVLQVIDQSIHTEILSNNLINTGLRITYLESYNISKNDYDYQIIRLEPCDVERKYEIKPWDMSIKSRIRRRLCKLLGLPIYD